MVVLEVDFKRRAYDGKWQKWVRTLDTENKYEYTDEFNTKTSFIPTMWVVAKVYDYELEILP